MHKQFRLCFDDFIGLFFVHVLNLPNLALSRQSINCASFPHYQFLPSGNPFKMIRAKQVKFACARVYVRGCRAIAAQANGQMPPRVTADGFRR
jgi:hypothetical protein